MDSKKVFHRLCYNWNYVVFNHCIQKYYDDYKLHAESEDYIEKNHNVTKIDFKNVNEEELKLDIPEFDFGK